MRYIKLENNIPVDYSIEQLFKDYPDAVIYHKTKKPNEKLLANYNVFPLITEPKPYLQEDETAEEGRPEFTDGEWHQTWRIRKLTAEEQIEIKNYKKKFIAGESLQKSRYNICQSCSNLSRINVCKKCGCIMPLKVKISNAECPIGKW